MGVVRYLRDKTSDFFTIERFNMEDKENSHHIKFIIENKKLISEYFEDNKLVELSDEEKYYDFKYCEYICSFEVILDKLPIDIREQLKEMIVILKSIKSIINRGNVIQCIISNYESYYTVSIDIDTLKVEILLYR